MKLELVEAQDLHVATLEGHERLDYARGGDTVDGWVSDSFLAGDSMCCCGRWGSIIHWRFTPGRRWS